MTVKTYTVSNPQDDLTVTAAERRGRDGIEAPFIHADLARVIATREGIEDIFKLSTAVWTAIPLITDIIQQVISLTGDWPFSLPGSEAISDYVVFYDAVLAAPQRYLNLLTEATKKADAAEAGSEDTL